MLIITIIYRNSVQNLSTRIFTPEMPDVNVEVTYHKAPGLTSTCQMHR